MVISGELHPIIRINIVYDGTAVSERAMRFAGQLAEATGWPLTVLPIAGVEMSSDDVMRNAAERAPGAMVLSPGPDDLTEAEQILGMARHGGFAIYVFGVYPDSWFHQLMLGGTTGRVLHELKHPVIAIR